MENKSHALAAGVFILAVTALLVAMTLWLTRDVANTVPYEITSTEAVTGLQVQAPVRYKGVSVGKVTRIGFDPEQRGRILVTLAVSPNTPVTTSTYASLAFQGVTGLSFVQLDDDGSSSQPPAAGPGPGGTPRIPLRSSALGQLTDQAASLIDKINQTTDQVNQLFGPDNQAALSRALSETAEAAAQAKALLQSLQHSVHTGIDPALNRVPSLLDQAGSTLQSTQAATAQARHAMEQLSQIISEARQGLALVTGTGGTLERIEEGANTVTSTTLPRIQNLTSDATRTIRRLDRLVDTLSENPQVLLFGSGAIEPGPGEPGFVPPAAQPHGEQP